MNTIFLIAFLIWIGIFGLGFTIAKTVFSYFDYCIIFLVVAFYSSDYIAQISYNKSSTFLLSLVVGIIACVIIYFILSLFSQNRFLVYPVVLYNFIISMISSYYFLQFSFYVLNELVKFAEGKNPNYNMLLIFKNMTVNTAIHYVIIILIGFMFFFVKCDLYCIELDELIENPFEDFSLSLPMLNRKRLIYNSKNNFGQFDQKENPKEKRLDKKYIISDWMYKKIKEDLEKDVLSNFDEKFDITISKEVSFYTGKKTEKAIECIIEIQFNNIENAEGRYPHWIPKSALNEKYDYRKSYKKYTNYESKFEEESEYEFTEEEYNKKVEENLKKEKNEPPLLYKLLGLEKDATLEEIKIAYKKLAKKYHPDLNKDSKGALEIIKQINEAYDVLSNEEKRREYDLYGTYK